MTPQDGEALDQVDYDALFAQSAMPTLVIDHRHRRILRINQACLDLLGLDESQILGRPGTDFMLPPSPEQVVRLRASRGDETALLMDVPTALGVRTCELTVLPSGVDGVAFVELIDQTDLLDAHIIAMVRSEELTRTTTALHTIAGRMAHDLRGPMTSIAGFANLLVDGSADLSEEEQHGLLRRIAASTSALAALTSSILGEADTGAARPEDDSRSPEDLFRVLHAVAEAQLAECGGALETSSDSEELPVAVGEIRQAVINLVSNSIKYREPDRPLRVWVDVRSAPSGTEIAVRDNGRGLAEAPLALFEAGARGSAAEGTTGAGLGLAFVQAAAERVGGSVTGAALKQGAEFVITLPDDPARAISPIATAIGERAPLSSAQLALVLEASPVPAFVIDIALRQIVSVNRASLDLLGFDVAEIIGRPGSDFLDERSIVEALRRRVLDDPDATSSVRTTLRSSTGEIPARVWIAAVGGTALAVAQAIADDPGDDA